MPMIFQPNSTLTGTLLPYPSRWTGPQTVLLPSPGANRKGPLWLFLACLRLPQGVTLLYTPSGPCVCMLAGVARKSELCLVQSGWYPPSGILFLSVLICQLLYALLLNFLSSHTFMLGRMALPSLVIQRQSSF